MVVSREDQWEKTKLIMKKKSHIFYYNFLSRIDLIKGFCKTSCQ